MKEVKVEMFALCQGAHNMNGHLTIVNTIDEFTVFSLPARISFGLAIKLYIRENVEGDKPLLITIVNKENKEQKFPVIQTNLHIERMNKASHINIAINLQNVLFETIGLYDIHMELEGKRLDDFAFEVIQK